MLLLKITLVTDSSYNNLYIGGAAVSADFRYEGQWFEAWSWPLCCILRQETLHHIVYFHPGVQMGTGDKILGVTLQWTVASYPGRSNNNPSCFML